MQRPINAIKKMVLALVNAKKKLCHYFKTHPITVITDFPIKQILSKPDLLGRLPKWAINLGIYDIRYIPRATKKGQVMTDFLVGIQSPWSFTKWGLDIIGELPHSPGGKRYVLMAIDYFTKWVTAEAYTIVNQSNTINFVSKHLIFQTMELNSKIIS